MSNLASVHVIVYGRVQGVYFRAFTSRRARELGLAGYARNLRSEEAVEVHAEGERKQLEELIKRLTAGPPPARVEKVVTDWSDYTGDYTDFSIRY